MSWGAVSGGGWTWGELLSFEVVFDGAAAWVGGGVENIVSRGSSVTSTDSKLARCMLWANAPRPRKVEDSLVGYF